MGRWEDNVLIVYLSKKYRHNVERIGFPCFISSLTFGASLLGKKSITTQPRNHDVIRKSAVPASHAEMTADDVIRVRHTVDPNVTSMQAKGQSELHAVQVPCGLFISKDPKGRREHEPSPLRPLQSAPIAISSIWRANTKEKQPQYFCKYS